VCDSSARMNAPSEEIYDKLTQGTYKCWNVRSVGYNACWQNGSVFIRLAIVASQICKILWKFELTAVQGHPWMVISLDAKSACAVALIICSNFGCI